MSKARERKIDELYIYEWSTQNGYGPPSSRDKGFNSYVAAYTDRELDKRLREAKANWRPGNILVDLGKIVAEAKRKFGDDDKPHRPGNMYWNPETGEAVWHFSSLPDRQYDETSGMCGKLDAPVLGYDSLAEQILVWEMQSVPGVRSAKASLKKPKGDQWILVRKHTWTSSDPEITKRLKKIKREARKARNRAK